MSKHTVRFAPGWEKWNPARQPTAGHQVKRLLVAINTSPQLNTVSCAGQSFALYAKDTLCKGDGKKGFTDMMHHTGLLDSIIMLRGEARKESSTVVQDKVLATARN